MKGKKWEMTSDYKNNYVESSKGKRKVKAREIRVLKYMGREFDSK